MSENLGRERLGARETSKAVYTSLPVAFAVAVARTDGQERNGEKTFTVCHGYGRNDGRTNLQTQQLLASRLFDKKLERMPDAGRDEEIG